MGAWEHNQISQELWNTGKTLKISWVRSVINFVKFDIYFLALSQGIFFGVITDN